MNDEIEEPLDLIWGAAAIAKVIGRTTKATYHMLETGVLPARHVGGRWVVSRRLLRKHFEDGAGKETD